MWKDYLNFKTSASESAEFVEHSIDCEENYLGLDMPICSVVSQT